MKLDKDMSFMTQILEVNMRKIGDVIRDLREERHLSQQQLADDLHITRASIGNYEAGIRIPKDDVKQAIADYFNVDMDYLYGKTLVRNKAREAEYYKEVDEMKLTEEEYKALQIIQAMNLDQLEEFIRIHEFMIEEKDE